MANEKGYVKFNFSLKRLSVLGLNDIEELELLRTKLFKLKLIGAYENGVGYGNLSRRVSGETVFIISGTRTGALAQLGPEHYTRIIDCELESNFVSCEGLCEPSSEAMTHAALYQASTKIQTIAHIHNGTLWNALLDHVPTTARDVEYGTPAMAQEILRLFREEKLDHQGSIAMGGHEDGVIFYGPNFQKVEKIIDTNCLQYLQLQTN